MKPLLSSSLRESGSKAHTWRLPLNLALDFSEDVKYAILALAPLRLHIFYVAWSRKLGQNLGSLLSQRD
jgi:hypothetical protein